jgi:hypothetical protein
VRRSAWIATLVAACAAAFWLLSRPAVEIDVDRGGRAFVRGLFSRTPLPETLYVRAVGSHTVIRLVNRDTIKAQLGIFDARAGETRDFTVAYPGTFSGYCSAHPASRQIVYVIE